MTDNPTPQSGDGEFLEFRYNYLVYARGQYEAELTSLTNRLVDAIRAYNLIKEAEQVAKIDLDLYYSKLN